MIKKTVRFGHITVHLGAVSNMIMNAALILRILLMLSRYRVLVMATCPVAVRVQQRSKPSSNEVSDERDECGEAFQGIQFTCEEINVV